MQDKSANYSPVLNDPATSAAAVTPSDTEILSPLSRMIYVGGAGDLSVVMLDGSSAVFKAIPAGTTLRIRVSKVLSTGTSATAILALS